MIKDLFYSLNHRHSSHRSRHRDVPKIGFQHGRIGFERLEDRLAMAIDFVSAFAGGSAAVDLGAVVRDIALDAAGNTLVVGRFAGTVDFDPGPGTYELTSLHSDTRNEFVAKYDASGNLLWAQRFGDHVDDGSSLQISADSAGNAYVVGSFSGAADFGSTILTSLGISDAFVTKVDANGNFQWSQRFGAAYADWGNGVAVDGGDNVLLIVAKYGTTNSVVDASIAKIDSNGNTIWTTVVGSSSSIPKKGNSAPTGWAYGSSITMDGAGNVYASGKLVGTVDFDAGTGTTSLKGAAFVMKLAPGGSLTWARSFTNTNGSAFPADIAIGTDGSVYSTGTYFEGVDFDPGTKSSQRFVLDPGGDFSFGATYVSALDSSGNFLWARSTRFVDGTTSQKAVPNAIALDGQGGIYIAGEFENTVDFDPGPGTFELTPASFQDAFIWKLDASGNFVWAGQMGGTKPASARGVAADGAGNVFVVGSFGGTADFDPGPGIYNLASTGVSDFFFVAKLVETGALAAAAPESQPSILQPPAEPTRRFGTAATDSALAGLGDDDSTPRDEAFYDELITALASGPSL